MTDLDLTIYDRYGLPDQTFITMVERLIEDAKWQVDRESVRPPFTGPIISHNGVTIQPSFTRLVNGCAPTEIPRSDYLTHNFDISVQYDCLVDIADRLVSACLGLRKDGDTILCWAGGDKPIEFRRELCPEGLLLTLSVRVTWI